MKNDSCMITNGVIVNGKNEPPFRGSLFIENGRIARVIQGTELPEDLNELPKEKLIDAGGALITPGFIDIHRHGDWRAFMGANGGDDELLNRQGLTTVVNGNCGLSVMPAEGEHAEKIRHFLEPVTGMKPDLPELEDADRDLASYLGALERVNRTVNTGMLAGNGTIRACAAGYHPGKLTAEEVKAVRGSIEKALADGALGISLGLGYAPEFEYDADGLVEVLEPLRGTDIPITTHIRSEGDGQFESVEEVADVACRLGIPLHVSHMKCIGRHNWHTGPAKVLEFIHRKNADGMKIDYDLYPYKTGSTQLFHVIPPAFQKGGTAQFMKSLGSRIFRDDLTRALKTPSHEFENIVELVGFGNIFAGTMRSAGFEAHSGKSILEIAEARHADPYETLYDLLLAEKCEVTMLDTIACDEDLRTFYKDPLSSVISDAIYPDGGRLHPRVYAAFPSFFIRYAMNEHLLAVEEAIYKMTAQPARVLGIDRGVIEEGKAADLCVFNIDDLRAPATFDQPDQMCTGFRYVIVGGKTVVENDIWKPEAAGAGSVIRRS